MITINTVSDEYFTLDGIQFAKIYQPIAQGLGDISIISIYDTAAKLKNSTSFDEFTVDGLTYTSQASLIVALLPVVWAGVSVYDVEQLENRVENLEENQYSGVQVYSTYAELPATGTLLVSYKVSNDNDSSLNGYYHWSGSAYVKDAGTATGSVESGEVDAVSGGTVYDYLSETAYYRNGFSVMTRGVVTFDAQTGLLSASDVTYIVTKQGSFKILEGGSGVGGGLITDFETNQVTAVNVIYCDVEMNDVSNVALELKVVTFSDVVLNTPPNEGFERVIVGSGYYDGTEYYLSFAGLLEQDTRRKIEETEIRVDAAEDDIVILQEEMVSVGNFDVTKNIVIGNDSTMNTPSDWIAAIGTPTFDIDSTVSGKMYIDFTSGNQEMKLENKLTVGEKCVITLKARLNSGSSMPLIVGAFVSAPTNNSFYITPTGTEQTFAGVIVASEVDFSIGALSAGNLGSSFEIDDVEIVAYSEGLSDKDILINVKAFGAVGDGLTDDTAAVQSVIDSQQDSVSLFFPKGDYLISQISIDGFNDVYIYGDNVRIVAKSGEINIISITDGQRVKIKDLFFDLNSVDLTDGFLNVQDITDFCKLENCDFKNFTANTTYGAKFIRVANDTGISGQETGIGLSMVSCNFYNDQVIALGDFDYETSTWLGKGVYLGDDCEYWRFVNCYFRCIHVGVEIDAAANGTFSACNFSYTNSYDWSTLSAAQGAIHVLTSSDNSGKLTIQGCHFNHNYGTVIMSDYVNGGRPIFILGNQFIANGYTPIIINETYRCFIHDNFFDRANVHVGLTNDQFSTDSCYIVLNDASQNSIKHNMFSGGGVEDSCIKTTGTSNLNVIESNIYNSALSSLVGASDVLRNNDAII